MTSRATDEPSLEHKAIEQARAVAAAFPGVEAAAITVVHAQPAGPCLVAYVAPGSIDQAALQAHARKHLPGHLIPAAIVVVGEIPVSTDGSVDWQALPVPDLGGLEPYRPPETARQEALCTIFAEVLRVPRIGVDDNFFSLGGRSVHAVVLAARIRNAFGVKIPMTELFDSPSVAELDRCLDAA